MGNLLLSGGGNAEQTQKINQFFIDSINQEPLAGDPNFRPHEISFKYIKSVFHPFGVNKITMWTDVTSKTIDDLKPFSAIYIGGGNPAKLLNDFRNAGFDEVLKQYFERDGTICGQSAGAMIFGQQMMNHPYPKAFNLVKGYSIECHYKKEDDETIKEYVQKHKVPVIALPEGTAIRLSSQELNVVGVEPAFVFKADRKIILDPKLL